MSGTIYLPSVMSLLLRIRFGGKGIATGTGFAMDSARGPVLITNRHNVTGRHQDTGQLLSSTGAVPDELEIIHNSTKGLGEWVSRIEPLYDGSGKPRWFEHPALGSKADMVALPLTQLVDVKLYPYTFDGPNIAHGPAHVVSVIGFPFGLQAGGSLAVWATGFVASEPAVDYAALPVFLIDCRARPGQSGSAVITFRGGGAVAMDDGSTAMFGGPVWKLLGIYSGRINEQSDIGIVWKATAIRELLDSVK